MIAIENLCKSFDGEEVLRNVNLTIPDGTIFGIAGRSGVGKSTLLRCINGLEKFDSGSLKVNGTELHTLGEKEQMEFRKNIGMIFQQFSLLSRMTVYENIALPMRYWKYPKEEIERRVNRLLELVGIPEKKNARPGELSGGQKQRVAIARALTMEPNVLLCDEATSALDPKTATAILSLLQDINKELGITIVVVTHQMEVLKHVCREMAIMEGGRVAEVGTVENIFIKKSPALMNLIGGETYTYPSGSNLEIILRTQEERQIATDLLRRFDGEYVLLGGGMDAYWQRTVGAVQVNLSSDANTERLVGILQQSGLVFRVIS